MKGSSPTRLTPAAASSLLAAFLAATLLVSCTSSAETPRAVSTYSVDPDAPAAPSTTASSGEKLRGVTTHSLDHYKLAEPYSIHHPFP